MTKAILNKALNAATRSVLRRQFAAFFIEMCREEPNWPSITDGQMVEGLADSLLDMGRISGKGVALLQTMVYELQERVNAELSSA